ncbi:transporter [Rhodocaloribacter litoris]|uniref:transporter n=1 Tax=Rhodocaloribacter litoris TaxID=2558931 RepID=UPI0014226FDD|nr:transporter [Rhodocaloribacter litoris]QXD16998.1 transporter [Rhodocaloribacter litoris]
MSHRSLRFALFLPAFMLPALSSFAQEAPLSTDRPGFGDGSAVMAPGRIQIEGGYGYSEDGPVVFHALGQALVRIGVLPRVELRLGLNSFLIWDAADRSRSGFEDSMIGAKVGLLEGDGVPLGRPSLTLIVLTSLPTGDDRLSADALQPEAKLAADWPLTDVLGLSANAGVASVANGADSREAQYTLTLPLGAGLPSVPGLGVYAGYRLQALPGLDTSRHDLEGGATYLLDPNTQLDVNFGAGVHPAGNDTFFVGLGVARRL